MRGGGADRAGILSDCAVILSDRTELLSDCPGILSGCAEGEPTVRGFSLAVWEFMLPLRGRTLAARGMMRAMGET